MPAPRLLPKRLVNAEVATERKQEIDKGKKLVEAIFALQETKSKEESELEEYRVNTLKTIQSQIEMKQRENERLGELNKSLKEERIRLEAPIDLTQSWKEVLELREKHESLSDHLLGREIEVTGRENDLLEAQNSLVAREKEIQRSEEATEGNLRISEEKREDTAELNNKAQVILTGIEIQKIEQDMLFAQKEQELEKREGDVLEREEEAERERVEIINEKRLLADRRATLERGFEELRRKMK